MKLRVRYSEVVVRCAALARFLSAIPVAAARAQGARMLQSMSRWAPPAFVDSEVRWGLPDASWVDRRWRVRSDGGAGVARQASGWDAADRRETVPLHASGMRLKPSSQTLDSSTQSWLSPRAAVNCGSSSWHGSRCKRSRSGSIRRPGARCCPKTSARYIHFSIPGIGDKAAVWKWNPWFAPCSS